MSKLVFLDLETTGLDPFEAEVWEFAAIVRDEDGTATEYHRFVHHDDDLADLPELFRKDHDERYDESTAITSASLAALVQHIAEGKARIVGAAPWFDAAFLTSYVDVFLGERPNWSHRLIDVETLAAGKLGRLMNGLADAAEALGIVNLGAHTAMGDARTAKAVYDAVMAP